MFGFVSVAHEREAVGSGETGEAWQLSRLADEPGVVDFPDLVSISAFSSYYS